jgi:hypothetical protein
VKQDRRVYGEARMYIKYCVKLPNLIKNKKSWKSDDDGRICEKGVGATSPPLTSTAALISAERSSKAGRRGVRGCRERSRKTSLDVGSQQTLFGASEEREGGGAVDVKRLEKQ